MSKNSLKISFLGGADSIGASCTLLEVNETRILIDCGIRFESGNQLPDLAQLQNGGLDGIVVTHAHTDHSGGLPVISEAFPTTPIYATPPSIDLIGILVRDALKLMKGAEMDGEIPLYTPEQARACIEAFRPVLYGNQITINQVTATFMPASHILGASMVYLATPGGTILVTGDYSIGAQLTVPAVSRPAFPVDLVISEATYGQRLHEDRRAAETRLCSRIAERIREGGRVLIPAFAIGRSQEILLILRRAMNRGDLPEFKVYVDGMIRPVCEAYRRHEKYTSRYLARLIRNNPHAFYSDVILPVESPEHRQKIIHGGPSVIVASSGMLSGGASSLYAEHFAPHERDTILITGYQDEESPGRALLACAENDGDREIMLNGRMTKVACRVEKYGLSAHADRIQMTGLIESLKPRSVVLVHGDYESKEALAKSLSCRDVTIGNDGLTIERSYSVRSTISDYRIQHALEELEQGDIERIRGLLGPAGSTPVSARDIAEAWLGTRPRGGFVQQFATILERRGLVRRDDSRRNLLWVLAPAETDIFPDEAKLEETLKQENPKGKLLEFCMRLRIEMPETQFSQAGAYHVASIETAYEGKPVCSGPCKAVSRKVAEQLAAKAVLSAIGEKSMECREVDIGTVEELRQANPKGKLLEWCAARRIAFPSFEHRPSPEGMVARVEAMLSSGEKWHSRWSRAHQVSLAEHAAADECLAMLSSNHGLEKREVKNVPPASNQPDPRTLLNQLQQQGRIKDLGYELQEHTGPNHQPVFRYIARAVTSKDQPVQTEIIEGASRKECRKNAAISLLSLLGYQT